MNQPALNIRLKPKRVSKRPGRKRRIGELLQGQLVGHAAAEKRARKRRRIWGRGVEGTAKRARPQIRRGAPTGARGI